MSGTVSRRVDLLVSGALSPQAIVTAFANEARRRRDEVIRSGEGSSTFQTFVDGREGAREETVKIGGTVLYRFNHLGVAAAYAYAFAVARSPSRSGRFRSSWVVAVNGQPLVGDIEQIPNEAVVTLVNIQPYSRKIDTGGQRIYVKGSITEDIRQATRRRFPAVDVERSFVQLSSRLARRGVIVPYLVRSRGNAEMTYPAVVLTTKPA